MGKWYAEHLGFRIIMSVSRSILSGIFKSANVIDN